MGEYKLDSTPSIGISSNLSEFRKKDIMRLLLLASLALVLVEGVLSEYYAGCNYGQGGNGRHLNGGGFCCIDAAGTGNIPPRCPGNTANSDALYNNNGGSGYWSNNNGGNSYWNNNNGYEQEPRETYTYVDPGAEFERTAVRADTRGCPYRRLGSKCNYFSDRNRIGRVPYNKCLHHDPSNPRCIGWIAGVPTRGFQCDFCCMDENNPLLGFCSLGFDQGAGQTNNRNNQTLSRASRVVPTPGDCIGEAKGVGHCNKATGVCEKYCCMTSTKEPCRTPICPNQIGSNNTEANEAEMTNVCWRFRNRRRSNWPGHMEARTDRNGIRRNVFVRDPYTP